MMKLVCLLILILQVIYLKALCKQYGGQVLSKLTRIARSLLTMVITTNNTQRN